MSSITDAIINVRSFTHPHINSLFQENLWGLPDNRTNRARWEQLSSGSKILLYGEFREKKGTWALCSLMGKKLADQPIPYWKPPQGYPLLIYLEPIIPSQLKSQSDLDPIKPIAREELASAFSIKALKALYDRWSIYSFGEKKETGITYSFATFEEVLNEFLARNKKLPKPKRPDHDELKELIYQMGLIQGKFPAKEYPIEGKRLDVVWRRTSKSVPYVAWEVSFSGGDLFKDLVKLKHAFDLWNAIPFLITIPDLIGEAKKWTEGYAHEIIDVFRLVNWDKVVSVYEAKTKTKELETELGVL